MKDSEFKTLQYVSQSVLPQEILDEIKVMQNRILRDLYEEDKIIINIGNFQNYLVKWFLNKQTNIKE